MLTPEQTAERYGAVAIQTETHVLRIKGEAGQITAFLHKIEDGKECLPRGYIIGHNYLSTKS